MARAARTISKTGIYHVMMRGSGKQIIFEDDGDRGAFIAMLRARIEKYSIELIAWCLMSNHVHLLIREEDHSLSAALHSLETAYARYFNEKTGRVGHLFQGRFKSVAIDDDPQLLCAVRYIHRNPSEQGICSPGDYPWSSYREYMGAGGIADTSMVLGMLGGSDGFARFVAMPNEDAYADQFRERLTDDEAFNLAISVLGGIHPSTLAGLGKKRRDKGLAVLRRAGLGTRRISRMTGVPESTIRRVLARAEEGRGEGDDAGLGEVKGNPSLGAQMSVLNPSPSAQMSGWNPSPGAQARAS